MVNVDRRQDRSPAGRGRAVRHSLRRAASPRAGARLRAGRTPPHVDWLSPAGRRVRVSSTRLVSFTQRAVAAILLRGRAARRGVRIVVQSELVANEPLPPTASDDPRAAAALERPLRRGVASRATAGAVLVHSTQASGLRWRRDGPRHRRPARARRHARAADDLARVTVTADVAPGEPLRLVKFLAYGWSSQRSLPALRDQVDGGARRGAGTPAGTACSTSSATYLDDFWDARRRRARGRPRAAAGGPLRAVPHAAGRCPRRAARDPRQGPDRPRLRRPHVLGHRDVRAAGADLHRAPRGGGRAALAALDARPRHERAPRSSGCEGAAFPWRTIRGEECSGYWPAGTAAFHINADIADAVVRYHGGHRRRGRSSATSASSSSSRPRGCGARSATTTPQGGSASTA